MSGNRRLKGKTFRERRSGAGALLTGVVLALVLAGCEREAPSRGNDRGNVKGSADLTVAESIRARSREVVFARDAGLEAEGRLVEMVRPESRTEEKWELRCHAPKELTASRELYFVTARDDRGRIPQGDTVSRTVRCVFVGKKVLDSVVIDGAAVQWEADTCASDEPRPDPWMSNVRGTVKFRTLDGGKRQVVDFDLAGDFHFGPLEVKGRSVASLENPDTETPYYLLLPLHAPAK